MASCFPQSTSSEALKEYVLNEPVIVKSVRLFSDWMHVLHGHDCVQLPQPLRADAVCRCGRAGGRCIMMAPIVLRSITRDTTSISRLVLTLCIPCEASGAGYLAVIAC